MFLIENERRKSEHKSSHYATQPSSVRTFRQNVFVSAWVHGNLRPQGVPLHREDFTNALKLFREPPFQSLFPLRNKTFTHYQIQLSFHYSDALGFFIIVMH